MKKESCHSFFDKLCKIYLILADKSPKGKQCVYFPEHVINRPDPCIYSQFLLLQMNQPVTWDNPDVKLFLNGVEQYTYDLNANTTYDVNITIHNSSSEKEALGTQIHVRWIEFGAGAQIRHPVGDLVVDVPVWPAVATVSTKWLTPSTPGHYCIEVELSHSNDGNPSNNLGWNNTQVKEAHSKIETQVRIFNRWIAETSTGNNVTKDDRVNRSKETRYNRIPLNLVEIAIDSYSFVDSKENNCDPNRMFTPRPPTWPVRVEPNLFYFEDNEAFRDVLLTIDAPDTVNRTENFNVTTRQGGIPTGGVTVTIPKNGGT